METFFWALGATGFNGSSNKAAISFANEAFPNSQYKFKTSVTKQAYIKN